MEARKLKTKSEQKINLKRSLQVAILGFRRQFVSLEERKEAKRSGEKKYPVDTNEGTKRVLKSLDDARVWRRLVRQEQLAKCSERAFRILQNCWPQFSAAGSR